MLANNIHPEFAAIVEKYTNGLATTSTEELDDTDSTKFDRFGFYHPDGVHERALTKEENQKLSRRLEKWQRMTALAQEKNSNWQRMFRNGYASEKLKRRIFKGIPQQYRLIVWPLLLGVAEIKKEHQNLYSEMLSRALASSVHLDQIDKDINRTFRNTTYFRSRYGSRQRSLFRILAAYSVYNNEIGYCQGMSELVGLFLTYIIEEEDVFWALSQLMTSPKHRMHGVFARNFPGLYRLFEHHERVVKKLLPPLTKHFAEQDLPTSTYALKWFMQCFLDRLPISLVLRLWDIYLLEGELILIAMAYNILKLHKKALLRMDQAQLACFFQDELVKNFRYDDDTAIDSLKDCIEQLHKVKLDRLPPPTPAMLPVRPADTFTSSMIWQSQPILSSKTSQDKDEAKFLQPKPQTPDIGRSRFPSSKGRIVNTGNSYVDRLTRRGFPMVFPRTPSGLDTSASILAAAAMSTRTRFIHPKPSSSSPKAVHHMVSPPTGGPPASGIMYPAFSTTNLAHSPHKSVAVSRKFVKPSSPSSNLSPSQRSSSTCYLHDRSLQSPSPSPINSDHGYSTTDSRHQSYYRQSSQQREKNDVVLISIRPRKVDDFHEIALNQMAGVLLERVHIQSPTFSISDGSDGHQLDSGRPLTIYASESSNGSSGFGDRIAQHISSTSSSTEPDDSSQLWRRQPGHSGDSQPNDNIRSKTPVSLTDSELSWANSSHRMRNASDTLSPFSNHRSQPPSSAPKDATLVPQESHIHVHNEIDTFEDDAKTVNSRIQEMHRPSLTPTCQTTFTLIPRSFSPEQPCGISPRGCSRRSVPSDFTSGDQTIRYASQNIPAGILSSSSGPVSFNQIQMPPCQSVRMVSYPPPALFPRRKKAVPAKSLF